MTKISDEYIAEHLFSLMKKCDSLEDFDNTFKEEDYHLSSVDYFKRSISQNSSDPYHNIGELMSNSADALMEKKVILSGGKLEEVPNPTDFINNYLIDSDSEKIEDYIWPKNLSQDKLKMKEKCFIAFTGQNRDAKTATLHYSDNILGLDSVCLKSSLFSSAPSHKAYIAGLQGEFKVGGHAIMANSRVSFCVSRISSDVKGNIELENICGKEDRIAITIAFLKQGDDKLHYITCSDGSIPSIEADSLNFCSDSEDPFDPYNVLSVNGFPTNFTEGFYRKCLGLNLDCVYYNSKVNGVNDPANSKNGLLSLFNATKTRLPLVIKVIDASSCISPIGDNKRSISYAEKNFLLEKFPDRFIQTIEGDLNSFELDGESVSLKGKVVNFKGHDVTLSQLAHKGELAYSKQAITLSLKDSFGEYPAKLDIQILIFSEETTEKKKAGSSEIESKAGDTNPTYHRGIIFYDGNNIVQRRNCECFQSKRYGELPPKASKRVAVLVDLTSIKNIAQGRIWASMANTQRKGLESTNPSVINLFNSIADAFKNSDKILELIKSIHLDKGARNKVVDIDSIFHENIYLQESCKSPNKDVGDSTDPNSDNEITNGDTQKAMLFDEPNYLKIQAIGKLQENRGVRLRVQCDAKISYWDDENKENLFLYINDKLINPTIETDNHGYIIFRFDHDLTQGQKCKISVVHKDLSDEHEFVCSAFQNQSKVSSKISRKHVLANSKNVSSAEACKPEQASILSESEFISELGLEEFTSTTPLDRCFIGAVSSGGKYFTYINKDSHLYNWFVNKFQPAMQDEAVYEMLEMHRALLAKADMVRCSVSDALPEIHKQYHEAFLKTTLAYLRDQPRFKGFVKSS